MENAYEVNARIHHEVLHKDKENLTSIYPVLISALHEQEHGGAKYELADIQVVRYERGAYRFNILSRKMLQIIFDNNNRKDGKSRLDSLVNKFLIENKTFEYLHFLVYICDVNLKN